MRKMDKLFSKSWEAWKSLVEAQQDKVIYETFNKPLPEQSHVIWCSSCGLHPEAICKAAKLFDKFATEYLWTMTWREKKYTVTNLLNHGFHVNPAVWFEAAKTEACFQLASLLKKICPNMANQRREMMKKVSNHKEVSYQ